MIDIFDLENRMFSQNNIFQGGLVRPIDFERWCNDVSMELWGEYTKQANRSQEIQDKLSPFLKSVQVTVQKTKSNYNLGAYPEIYGRFSSARLLYHESQCVVDDSMDQYEVCENKCVPISKETDIEKEQRNEDYKKGISEAQITKVDSSRWAALLNHARKKPTFDKPAMTQYNEGFKVAPVEVTTVVMDYYLRPKYQKFVFTTAPGNEQTGAGDQLIYNKVASGKLEWNEDMIPEFIERLSKIYGRYTRNEFLVATSKNQP